MGLLSFLATPPNSRAKQQVTGLPITDALETTIAGPYIYEMGNLLTPGASAFSAQLVSPGFGIPMISEFGRPGVAAVCCRKYDWDSRAVQVDNVATVVTVNPSNGGVPVGTFGLTTLLIPRGAILG